MSKVDRAWLQNGHPADFYCTSAMSTSTTLFEVLVALPEQ